MSIIALSLSIAAIIIALAMACCFLYAKIQELESKIQVLKDSRELLKAKKDAAVEESLAYRCQLDSLGRIPTVYYSIKRGVHGFDVMASFMDADGYVGEAVIKSFYCSDKDNDNYARRCAEELLDKLNEKI